MTIDVPIAIGAFIVGIAVGLTGMGGGALMTPVLVILFRVQPLAAVSSDRVASFVMKPFGSAVHLRRGTVQWGLVAWLCFGSVPAAFLSAAPPAPGRPAPARTRGRGAGGGRRLRSRSADCT